ncbi:MAG: hypothetical protein IPH76_07530 [Xanthomonadales bacterium]|nr:hypothetical protein [Xanthomonadales bacterium]
MRSITAVTEDSGSRCRRQPGTVGLRHLQRCQLGEAKQQRGMRRDIGARDQRFEQALDFGHAEIETETHRRQIVGTCQRIDQRDLAVLEIVGIVRLPGLAIALAQRDRGVRERAQQRPALRLRQCHQVHERFDQRTDRTRRHRRTIEAKLLRIATTDHCFDGAAGRARHHHRRLQPAAVFRQGLDLLADRALGILLG